MMALRLLSDPIPEALQLVHDIQEEQVEQIAGDLQEVRYGEQILELAMDHQQ